MVTRNKTREQKCVTRNKPREQKCVTRNKHREQKMVTRNYFIYIQPIRFELGLIGPIESLWGAKSYSWKRKKVDHRPTEPQTDGIAVY